MKKLLLLMFSLTLIFMFSTSAIAQQGKTVKVTNNNQLIEAIDNPTVKTIELAGGYYDYLDSYVESGSLLFKSQGSNGSRANCNYIITPSDTCFAPVPPATVMVDTAKADAQGTQGAPPLCPTANSGLWSVVSGPGNVNFHLATNEYTMPFDVDEPGVYTLKYSWGPPHNTYVQTEYSFYAIPEVFLSPVADVCGLSATINWNYTIDITGGAASDTIVTWSVTPSTGVTLPGTTPPTGTLTVPNCGSYDLTLTVVHNSINGCSADTTITIEFYDTPTVDAGVNDSTCGLTYTLHPTSSASCWASGFPTTNWSLISGPTGGTASWVGDDVTVTLCGQYEFQVEIFNWLCSATDNVIIDFWDSPYNVYAGPDTSICFTTLPFTLTPSYDLDCPNSPTTAWSKISGPGTVTFTDNDFNTTECGPYVFRYTVTNAPCPSVSDDVNIYIYDEPTIDTSISAPIPSDVCHYTTNDFYLWYTANCINSTIVDTIWTVTPPAGGITAIITYQGSGLWNIVVDWCGDWIFNFEVVNGSCSHDTTFTITFHEQPDPGISHDGTTEITADTVFACGTTDYIALDKRTCDITPLTHTWTVSGGLFANGMTTTTGSAVKVTWGNTPGGGALMLLSEITALPTCYEQTSISIEIELPTFAGQVKYWNEFETYMPTPFPTDINGTYPPDYFYVTLYEGTCAMTEIETVIIEPRLMPDLIELLSYFEFTLPVDVYACDAEFLLRIWDGGLLYDPGFPSNGFNRYLGANYTYNNWGGVNATDALALQKMATNIDINGSPYNYTWVGPNTLSPPYGYYSKGIADVNNSDAITALDALIANYRAVGLIPKYPSAQSGIMYSPNFEVTGRMVPSLPYITWSAYFDSVANIDDVPFAHSDEDYQYYDSAVHHKYTSEAIPWEGDNNYMNIYYECLGDINASYVPTSAGFKVEPTMEIFYENQLVANQGDVLSIPISLDKKATLGALTLNLTYMNDLIEVIGTNYENDFFNINHEEGYVRIGWFSVDAINVKANETIAIIKLRVLADIEQGTRLFELGAMTELADPSANRIDGINFKALGVTTDKGALIGTELTANNYPNPFTNKTNISYTLPEAGKVQVVIYSKMGQIVSTIVDQSQDAGQQTVEFNHSDLNAGVYFYKITLNGLTKYYTVTKSMVVVK